MSLLKITDLTQRFGGLTAVSDLQVDLKEGGLNGLIGPNGAGKTTIFNMVSGFYTPTEGTINFDGNVINGKKPHSVTAMGIGRTFQNIRLWHDMTVLDNIRLSQHYHLGYSVIEPFFRTKNYFANEKRIEDKSMELLDVFKLQDIAHEYPKNLPYGIQRRVEIARALATDPKLLLLDEPAAGLSSSDVSDLIDHIKWIHDNFDITIWMIEHQMEVIMNLCQYIKVIDFGKTIAEGTPDEIQKNPQVIKAYLGDEGEIYA
ncbi:MAG: ABC transporter ATP-binding protein [Spirochaetia bacterium]|jgi:branched-chain amino acid transport system ATP-binding protein|nr:ABC transporter ATP-binding protein [Spirochaetia bacterium]